MVSRLFKLYFTDQFRYFYHRRLIQLHVFYLFIVNRGIDINIKHLPSNPHSTAQLLHHLPLGRLIVPCQQLRGQSALYKIAGGGGASALTIEKLCQGYPNLSIEWLIFEIGEMWKDSNKVEVTEGDMENLLRRVAHLEQKLLSIEQK